MEGGWVTVPDLEAQPEPRRPAASPSVYLHGLRRHWVLATTLGVLCAALTGVTVYFAWGSYYTAAAHFQIATEEPEILARQGDRFIQGRYDIYKDTQGQLVKSQGVLTAALRDPEIASLGVVKRGEKKYGGQPEAWLQDRLQVTFPGDAEVMELRLTEYDPTKGVEVAKVVNEVRKAYEDLVLGQEQKRRADRLTELEQICAAQSDQVKRKETEVRAVAEQMLTADPDTLRLREQTQMQQYMEFQGLHSQVKIALQRAQSDLSVQLKLLANAEIMEIQPVDVEKYVNDNPLVKQLYQELGWRMAAQAQVIKTVNPSASSAHAQRYTDDAKDVQAQIDRLIGDAEVKLRKKMLAEIDTEMKRSQVQVDGLKEQEKQLAQEVDKKQKEVEELGKSTVELQMSRAELERLNAALANVRDERERMRMEFQSKAGRVRLLDQPTGEPTPEARRGIHVAVTILATILGLCLPVICVTWWDTRAERINTPEDVSKGLGLTVLGSVPAIPSRAIRQLGSAGNRHQTWQLRLTESIDGIAARLLRQAKVEQTRVILISSAGTGEGKTTLATQLAMSLARNGRRTALVDFDLRRPAFDKVLGLPLEPGVSEVLRGQNPPSEVVHETGTENLCVVTAGRWDRQALTALANGAAGTLFDALRTEFEFVVVDAAPILPVADTRFVSQHVDAVILSVFRDVSRAPKIAAAREILEAFGVSTVEAVVTGPTDNLPDKDLKYESSLPG
jgi:capsular exopolysaccharide synthesis family protein